VHWRLALILLAGFVVHQPLMAAETPQAFRAYVVPEQAGSKQMKLPSPAIVVRNGIPGVFIARDGLARFIMVKPGKKNGSAVEILSGLLPGDRVILGPIGTLHDGSPVNLNK